MALHIVFLKTTGRLPNSVEIVPVSVLEYLGPRLGCTPPRVTSIRALYRRRRTLFDHQQVALDVLGLDTLGEHAERGLVAYLRREATAVFDTSELMARARSWLAELEQHGALMLAAAGNEARPDYVGTVNVPASLPLAVSVGTTNPTGAIAYFSPGPDGVDIFVPGVDIFSISARGEQEKRSGSSYSTAIAGGPGRGESSGRAAQLRYSAVGAQPSFEYT